jgi:ferredoxin
MGTLILQKDKLKDFLSSLDEYTLWAPVQKDTITLFEVIKDPKNVSLDLKHQAKIPKEAVFPQTELLFSFDKDGIIKKTDSREMKESIVFGIRPCDARSFLILDPVFEGAIPDPYYLSRRNKAILVGLTCTEPFSNCFCTSLGGNPFSQKGLDLIFTELNGKFYVEVVTEKGKKIIDKTSSLFTAASTEDTKQREELAQASESKIKRQINLNGIPEKLAMIFEHPFWKQIATKCIGCGICTYTCPTCYCFDIQDEPTLRKGRRVRIWDSCMFGEYTLHASGHNPRPTRAERLKNRIYHKFKFNVDNFGVPGCVGCGRCISLCPFNVDLIESLSAIKSIE